MSFQPGPELTNYNNLHSYETVKQKTARSRTTTATAKATPIKVSKGKTSGTAKKELKVLPGKEQTKAKAGPEKAEIRAAATVHIPVTEEVILMAPLELIDSSPFNYRMLYNLPALNELAATIKTHGVLSELIARMRDNRYQIVAGERRFRAARIAGLSTLPVKIREYTDQEVKEIQLIENLQRENTHPMEDAFQIGHMIDAGKTTQEVCLALGKSRAYVNTRLLLLQLIPDIQAMVMAEELTLVLATDIAQLTTEAQQELYELRLKNWKEKGGKKLTAQDISKYRYDLNSACFSKEDTTLGSSMGACTGCRFNSATMETLFPDAHTKMICSNGACYQDKERTHITHMLCNAYNEHKPEALIVRGNVPDIVEELLQKVEQFSELTLFRYWDVKTFERPQEPDREDFRKGSRQMRNAFSEFMNEDEGYYDEFDEGAYYDEEDEDADESVDTCVQAEAETDGGETGMPEYDEEEYTSAMEDYRCELENYLELIETEKIAPALLYENDTCRLVHYTAEKGFNNTGGVTSKEVEQALKEGTATVELLEGEIKRREVKEIRNKQLDREKIHAEIYERMANWLKIPAEDIDYTDTDEVTVRFLVYDSLEYTAKNAFQMLLNAQIPGLPDREDENEAAQDEEESEEAPVVQDKIITALAALSPSMWTYLIRLALLNKPDAKYVNSRRAHLVVKAAEVSGIDLQQIRDAQDKKAEDRIARKEERISELNKKIETLTPTV